MSDKWKYVSVGRCLRNVIVSLIMLCVVFVPITFGGGNLVFTYQRLPYAGDGTIEYLIYSIAEKISLVITLNDSQMEIVKTVMLYAFYAYFLIFAANILFSLILLIFRNKVLRKIFEIFGVLFGFAFIAITLSSLALVGLSVFDALKAGGFSAIEDLIYNGGVTTFLAMFILSLIMIFKQFKFYKRPFDPYDSKKYKNKDMPV